jgi:hypothetical protein
MTQFQHVSSIGSKNRVASLEDNIKSFLDWSFLNIGGFINVSIPTSGIDTSNTFSSFKPVTTTSVTPNRVWEATRKDWVYESGISSKTSSPSYFSGVYLNNTFLPAPTGSGAYGYSVNYPLGRLTFNFNLAPSSTVKAAYSHRYIQVYKASDAIWWKELQKDTYNPDNFKSTNDYLLLSNHRVQLPAIVVELIPRTVQIPYQLGSADNIIIQDVFLHIYSENANQRNIIADALIHQKDKTLRLYDISEVIKNNKYSLNKFGNINPSGYNYPQLVELFSNYWCTIKDSDIVELNSLSSSLHNGIVRWSIEIFP